MNVIRVPQINLLPDIKINALKARLRRNVMMAVCFGILAVCGTIMTLLVSSLTAVALIKSGIDGNVMKYKAKIEHEQRSGDLNEYMTIQNQLKQISELKKKQEKFSLVFDYLSKLNPTGRNRIKINNMSIRGLNRDASSNNNGIIDIAGTTSDYASLYVLKLTLEKAKLHYHLLNPDGSTNDKEKVETLFSNVSVSGNGQGNPMIFAATLKYNPVMFAYNITDTTIEVPNETISDSRNNVPKNDRKLFDVKPDDKKPKSNSTKPAGQLNDSAYGSYSTNKSSTKDTNKDASTKQSAAKGDE